MGLTKEDQAIWERVSIHRTSLYMDNLDYELMHSCEKIKLRAFHRKRKLQVKPIPSPRGRKPKVSPKQALEIALHYADGHTYKSLSKLYDLPHSTIDNILFEIRNEVGNRGRAVKRLATPEQLEQIKLSRRKIRSRNSIPVKTIRKIADYKRFTRKEIAKRCQVSISTVKVIQSQVRNQSGYYWNKLQAS